MLTIENLRAGYFGSEVLHGISVKAVDKKVTLLVGPNGAGKSTLLATIVGLVEITDGAISYKSNDITRSKSSEIIRMGISYVPQGGNVFPNMSVKENLEMGAYLLKQSGAVKTRVGEVTKIFPVLGERLGQKAGLLSGGERQMLAIGRAIMSSPDLILLDEPSAGLDVGKQEVIFNKLQELNKSGLGILLVEQNVKYASKIADYLYLISGGVIKYAGDPSLLKDQRAMTEMFFGSARKETPE